MYLWSRQVGNGKTTAALMLLDRAYGESDFDFFPTEAFDVMWGFIDYRTFPRFMENVGRGEATWNSHMAGGKLTEGRFWNFVAKGALLVIDDVCEQDRETMRLGHDPRGLFKRILDERGGLPTIVTSNLSPHATGDGKPSELSRILDPSGIVRMTDRVLCGTVIEMTGESLRWK